MSTIYARQSSSADVRRSDTQGLLVITSVPAGAEAQLGIPLIAAGALATAGTYSCDIDTYDWSAIEVTIMASAVSGTVTPSLHRLYANRVAIRSTTSTGALSAGVAQTLSTSTIIGTQRFRLDIVVGAGASATFAPGSVAATPTAYGEFNGA